MVILRPTAVKDDDERKAERRPRPTAVEDDDEREADRRPRPTAVKDDDESEPVRMPRPTAMAWLEEDEEDASLRKAFWLAFHSGLDIYTQGGTRKQG
jgi:hypothetical protein